VQRLDMSVRLWAAGVDVGDARAEALHGRVEARALELVAVVAEDALELPAGSLQLAGDAAGERRGLLRARVARGADDELGPGEGGEAVDRGQLPDGAVGALEAADEEAVEADELARPLDLDVRLRLGLPRRLVGRPVAGDEGEPLRTGVEPVPAEAAPDAVSGDDDPSPLLAAELGGDPARAEAGWAIAKATIRSSTIAGSWLGIFGFRRSRGLSTSSPCRSTSRFQR
jgi:hypothetical protein